MVVCLELDRANPIFQNLGSVIQQPVKAHLKTTKKIFGRNKIEVKTILGSLQRDVGIKFFFFFFNHFVGSVSCRMAPCGLVRYRQGIQVKL